MVEHIAGRARNHDKLDVISEHIHSASKCYPTGAAGVTVTCGSAAPWTLGNYAEVVPVNTITKDFDIHFIVIEGVSAAATYELVLYCATTEIGRIRVTSVGIANNTVIPDCPFQIDICTANSQIQAKVMSSTGDADTITISLFYHEY